MNSVNHTVTHTWKKFSLCMVLLRGHFKPQNNQQKAQKHGTHDTKKTVRSLVYSISETRRLRAILHSFSWECVCLGQCQLCVPLHVSASNHENIISIMRDRNTFQWIGRFTNSQEMRINFLTCIPCQDFFLNSTIPLFFTSS